MENKKEKTTVMPANASEDNFRLEFSICAKQGDKVLFQFTGGQDVPLGMHLEHLRNTGYTLEMLLENTIKTPAQIAMRQVITGRLDAARKEAEAAEALLKKAQPTHFYNDPSFWNNVDPAKDPLRDFLEIPKLPDLDHEIPIHPDTLKGPANPDTSAGAKAAFKKAA